MRNIYEIIAEQKAIIDVNISSYDLDHTICHFSNNDYYLQEGLGESIKGAANKVIAFIRAVIAKIRELIKKMIDYLTGGRPAKVTMEDIKKGKKGGDNKSNNKEEKKPSGDDKKEESNVYDKNMFKGRNPESMSEEEILRGSLRTVNMIKYVGFDIKEQITDKFFGAVNATARNFTENYDHADKLFIKSIEQSCFKGAGSFKKVKDVSIAERIQLEINEPKEPVQMKVSEIDVKVIMTYIEADMKYGASSGKEKGKGIKSYLKKTEEETTKNLKELESKLNGLNSNGGNVSEQSFANINKVVSMASVFINFITTNVFKAYNTLYNVFEQAMMDYVHAYNIQL